MRSVRMLFASVCVAVAASAVSAGTHPHDRNGFMIGFGVGGGSATIEDADEREGGVAGNFRIGYAVRPDLVLHYEGSAWAREYEEPEGDVTLTLSTHTAAVTYYPPGSGLLLRGGLGFGVAGLELDTGSVTISDDESGFGLLLAVGYEWRLTKKFALGPHAEFSYMTLDVLESANVVSGALDFTWYW